VKIVVDSNAWIEIFSGSEAGDKAIRDIMNAEAVFTPDTVLAEIARKYHREGFADSIIKERLGTVVEASEVIQIREETALGAAKAYQELDSKAKEEGLGKPSLFDAIVLATAREVGGKVLTGDRHFQRLPETIWLE
jgi:predicted nucleic acid-binding protein